MARPKKGWKLYLDRRRKIYFVRFTHDGRRHTLPTGERDPGAAAAAAARTYAEVVSGQRAAALQAKVAGKVAAGAVSDAWPRAERSGALLIINTPTRTNKANCFTGISDPTNKRAIEGSAMTSTRKLEGFTVARASRP